MAKHDHSHVHPVQRPATILIYPGMFLALLGIGLVLGGDDGFSLAEMSTNILDNPLSYILSFLGAFFWSVYCTITSRMEEGKNGVAFFFMPTTIILWAAFFLSGASLPFSASSLIYLIFACAAFGLGYAAWNTGMLHGNIAILATASYFIPIFSSLFTTFMVKAPLSAAFWEGCFITSIGSLLCWLSTRGRNDKTPRRSLEMNQENAL